MKRRVCTAIIGTVLLLVSGPGPALSSTADAPPPADDTEAYEGQAFPEEPNAGGAVQPDLVVEAQNEVLQDVLRSSPAKNLTVSDIDELYTTIDEEVLNVSPVSGIRPHLNNLIDLQSFQAPHLWLPELSRPPVVTFHADPITEASLTGWTLKIVNFRGVPIRVFEGNGAPPATIPWDGRDDRDRMIKVGFPYSYLLNVTDRGTNSYNYGGSSFRITAVDYFEDDVRRVEIVGRRLFERGKPDVTDGGFRFLDKAIDAIREHPLSAVTLEVTAPRKALGQARADAVAQYAAESLTIPREEISTMVVEEPEADVEMDGFVRFQIHSAR